MNDVEGLDVSKKQAESPGISDWVKLKQIGERQNIRNFRTTRL
jgi:hypothetical protein